VWWSLGYAQFPGGSSSTDGVVITIMCPGAQVPKTFHITQEERGTHELVWDVLIIFGADANCGSDLVNTPNSRLIMEYLSIYSTCTGSPVEMTMNYMDYFGRQKFMFSEGTKKAE
jgi:hypothetical protein